jgi:alpha-beta hydrolase superfamily lysophospholipase
MKNYNNEAVVLLHGLALSTLFMKRIEIVLSRAGYTVYNIDYPSRDLDIDILTHNIHKQLLNLSLDRYTSVHFIGHSLGGIIFRNLLSKYSFNNFGTLIALASPNRGTFLVDKFKNFRLFSWYFGPAALQLDNRSSYLEKLQFLPKDYYVITGNNSRFTLFGWWFDEANDGTVSVESTKAVGMDLEKHFICNVSHFSILFNSEVLEKILWILNRKVSGDPKEI